MYRWLIVMLTTGCFSKWEAVDGDGDGLTSLDGDCWDFSEDPVPPEGALNHGVTASDIYLGAEDLPYDGIDANCDGLDDFDQDEDGFVPVEYVGIKTLQVEDSGTLPSGDCWDSIEDQVFDERLSEGSINGADVNPDAEDLPYDGIDANCDGLDDFDQDGDGFVPSQYDGIPTLFSGIEDVLPSGDCWDSVESVFVDPTGEFLPGDVNPNATEIYYDGADIDCTGDSDCDQDGDGFEVLQDACIDIVLDGSQLDCNDLAGAIFPNDSAEIYFNGIDDNCDAQDGDGDRDGDGFWSVDYPFTASEVDSSVLFPTALDDCWDDPTTTPAGFEPLNGFSVLLASEVNPSAFDRFYDGIHQDCLENSDFDQDGDGFDSRFYTRVDGTSGEDCIDSEQDPDFVNVGILPNNIYPGNLSETYYDGVDQNCDFLSDFDQDEDGQDSSGYGGDDCNDTDADIYFDTALSEGVNDGVDQNCDGMEACYIDADVDGFGNSDSITGLSTELTCVGEVGFSNVTSDCDDGDGTLYPSAPELCDGQVNACGGSLPLDEIDNDGDGFVECTIDSNGWDDSISLKEGDDCDDGDAALNPDTVWYADLDVDGFGDLNNIQSQCLQPSGYLSDNTDCDDGDGTLYPSAPELCDGQVNACGGSLPLDEIDNDGDGFVECTIDSNGWDDSISLKEGDDCDDDDGTLYPSAPELCDGQVNACGGSLPLDEIDNDGDGFVECTIDLNGWDDVTNQKEGDDCDDGDAALNPDTVWYADVDVDGFGDNASTTQACLQPSGYLSDNTDCDDSDDTLYPSAPELCDGQVNACGNAFSPDEIDNDGDGFVECTIDSNGWDGVGAAKRGGDCADNNASLNPDTVWYADADVDGFGDNVSTTQACLQPSGYLSDNTDCDDGDDTLYPSALELCDGQVNACGGSLPLDEIDNDGDGFVECTIDSNGWDDSISLKEGDDCDDGDASLNPDTVWYADLDVDGFGDLNNTQSQCLQPSGYLSDNTDCDDGDDEVYIGATDIIDDGIDQDCDGSDATGLTAEELLVGDLIITEFLIDGYIGGGADEWFELYNTATEVVDIFGLTIEDNANSVQVTEHVEIQPGTYFVMANNDSMGSNGNFDLQNIPHYDYPYVQFNNGGDDIALVYDDGSTQTILASITYDNEGVLDFHYAKGVSSIVSDRTIVSNDDSTLWCSSTSQYNVDVATGNVYVGTPGAPNDSCDADADGSFYYVDETGDCDDSNAAVNPSATELLGDGVDQDCDGTELCVVDDDEDGYGNENGTTGFSTSLTCTETGFASTTDDCDDSDADVYPYAPENIDSVDHNCDGLEDLNTPITSCVGDAYFDTSLGFDTYFLVCSETDSWNNALTICENAGYDGLPTVKTSGLNADLVSVFSGNLWMGLNDLDNEGIFAWSDGTVLDLQNDYQNWKNGFSSNQHANEDCIRMNNSSLWEDKSCSDSYKIACSIELP